MYSIYLYIFSVTEMLSLCAINYIYISAHSLVELGAPAPPSV